MTSSPTRPHRIPSLDGLRAISIMLVVFGHAYETIPNKTRTVDTLMIFFGNARLGVLTFFVISGYLITYLLRRELESRGRISLRGFYFRRVLRIFPAFYSYLIVIGVLALTGVITIKAAELLSAATFTTNYQIVFNPESSSGAWFVGHFWTLSLEEQFYLLWPLTLVLGGLRRAKWIALALVVLSPFVRVATYVLWPESRGAINNMLHTASDTLMIGCAVALFQGEPWFEARLKRWITGRAATIAAIFVLIVSPILATRFAGLYLLPIGMTLESLSIMLIIVYAARNADSTLGRLLNSRPFVFVGVLSYSLYLWQQLFLTPLNQTWFGIFPLNILACFIAALLSYYLIEKPFLSLKGRKKRLPEIGTSAVYVKR